MLKLTHDHVLFRNSHLANDFNFNVNEPVRVEIEVYVDFATSLFIANVSSNKISNNNLELICRLHFKYSLI